MSLLAKKSGTWRLCNQFTKVSGTWREVKNVFHKVAGIWRPTWSYYWNLGTWGGCSVGCGGGVQYRAVECKRSDGIVKADAFCSAIGSKPATVQACNTQACYPYRDCQCGNGTYANSWYIDTFLLPWENAPFRGYGTYNVYLKLNAGATVHGSRPSRFSDGRMYFDILGLVSPQQAMFTYYYGTYETGGFHMCGSDDTHEMCPNTAIGIIGSFRTNGTKTTENCNLCQCTTKNPDVNNSCFSLQFYVGQYIYSPTKLFENLAYTFSMFENYWDHQMIASRIRLVLT